MNANPVDNDQPRPPLSVPLALLFAALAVFSVYTRYCIGDAPAGRDLVYQYLPYQQLVREAVRERDLPLWNERTFCGRPLMADIQVGVLYPPNWLHHALPLPLGFTLLFLAHALWSFFGYLRLGSAWRLHPAAALLMAVLGTFSGFLVVKLQTGIILFHQTAAWFPWCALALTRLARAPSLGRSAPLAAAVSMMILAGAPQIAFIQIVLLAFIGAAFLVAPPTAEPPAEGEGSGGRPRERIARFAAFAALSVVMALAITSIQTLETKRMTEESFDRNPAIPKETRWEWMASGSLHPSLLALMVNPGAFGPGHDEFLYMGRETGFSEACGYLPAAVWLLFVPLAFGARGRPSRLALLIPTGAFALFALMIAFGRFGILYRPLFDFVPGFDLFRVPARWLHGFTLAGAVWGAIGLDQLIARSRAAGVGSNRFPAVAAAAVAVAILAQWFASLGLPRVDASAVIPGMTSADANAVVLSHFAARGIQGIGFLAGTALVLFVLMRDAGLRADRPGSRVHQLLPYVPAVLALAELSMLARPNQPATPIREFEATHYPATELVTRLRGLSTGGRILWTDSLLDWRLDQNTDEILTNAMIMHGLNDARGYDPINSRRLGEWFNAMAGIPPDTNPGGYMRVPGIARPAMLTLSAVELVLSYSDLSGLPGLEAADRIRYAGGTLGIWRNVNYAGFAFIIPTRLLPPDAGEGPGTPSPEVIVEILTRLGDAARVPVRREGNGAYHVSVEPTEPSILLFLYNAYGGWHVEIDGRPGELAAVPGLPWCGVEVPWGGPGRGKFDIIITRSMPDGFGIVGSAAGISLLFAAAISSFAGKRRSAHVT